jgi:hypothetical protein
MAESGVWYKSGSEIENVLRRLSLKRSRVCASFSNRRSQMVTKIMVLVLVMSGCSASPSGQQVPAAPSSPPAVARLTEDELQAISRAQEWTKRRLRNASTRRFHGFIPDFDKGFTRATGGAVDSVPLGWKRFCRADEPGTCLWTDEDGGLHIHVGFAAIPAAVAKYGDYDPNIYIHGLTHCDLWRGWYAKDLPKDKTFECEFPQADSNVELRHQLHQ